MKRIRSVFRQGGFTGLMRTGADYLTRPALLPGAVWSLRRAAATKTSVVELVGLVFDFRFGNIRIAPQQVRSEITALCELVMARRPEAVLEIGTAKGGTLFLYTRLAAPSARLVSVDLPAGEFGGGYPLWRTVLYRGFATPGQSMSLVRANSHLPQTRDRVRELLKRPVDFLFIDGDHSYEGVKADFQAYSTLVRPGGLIAFHDIVPGPEGLVGGVPRFWQELKSDVTIKGRLTEIVDNWRQGGFGIGVVSLD